MIEWTSVVLGDMTLVGGCGSSKNVVRESADLRK